MSTTALCYKCGAKKSEPTKMCGECMATPRNFDELVLSYCLSLECLKPDTLKKCRQIFKQKKRPPKFRPEIKRAAARLAEERSDVGEQSIQFPSELMDFADLEEDESGGRRSVPVQIIGRVEGQPEDEPPEISCKRKTCHFETWIVGKDITQEQVDQYMDGEQVFVWYRWMGNRWSWSPISRGKFAQLKSVEDGSPL